MRDDVYQVHSPNTETATRWVLEEPSWKEVARGVVLEDDFHPLTIKALYVTGLIYQSCLAVNLLLNPEQLTSTTFYPSYAVFSAAVELLGRCVRGNPTDRENAKDLTAGFQWLASPSLREYSAVPESHVLAKTINFPWTIGDLVSLRHFSAHGQAVNRTTTRDFDYLVLEPLPKSLGAGMRAYLRQLMSVEAVATNLANASISPLRSRPIFDALWGFMSDRDDFPENVERAILRMDWSYKSPFLRSG